MTLIAEIRRRTLLSVALPSSAVALLIGLALAVGNSGASAAAPPDHAAHADQAASGYLRSLHQYTIPQVVVVNQDGRRIPLSEVLPSDTPIALTFIFTHCRTLCPLLSATLATLRKNMGGKADAVRVVSITIDPQNDTPERLHDYAAQLGAGAGWQFYTGETADVDEVLHAFAAYAQVKDEHRPLFFLRAARSTSWVRFEGAMTAEALAGEMIQIGTRAALAR